MKSSTLFAVLAAAAVSLTANAKCSQTLNATGFEGLKAGETVTSGIADTGVTATGSSYFYVEGEGDGIENSTKALAYDSSVTAPTADELAPGFDGKDVGKELPQEFRSGTNAQYLKLNTEGSTLWRTINVGTYDEEEKYKFNSYALESDLYLDTVMQFTKSEEAPEAVTGEKIALWLDSEGVLCVKSARAAVDDFNEWNIDASNPTEFKTTTSLTAGQWYRVTIRAIKDITPVDVDLGESGQVPAFVVYINGNVVEADVTYDNAVVAGGLKSDLSAFVYTTDEGKKVSNKLFPSLAGCSDAPTIDGLGFQGTGVIDDFVATTRNPAIDDDVTYDPTFDCKSGLKAVKDSSDGTYSFSGLAEGYAAEVWVNGVKQTLEGGKWTPDEYTEETTATVVARKVYDYTATAWYSNDKLLAAKAITDVPVKFDGSNYISAFHGQGFDQWLALPTTTSKGTFSMYNLDTPAKVTEVAYDNLPESLQTANALRGAAVSKFHDRYLTLSYAKGAEYVISYPLNATPVFEGEGKNVFSIANEAGYAFDSATFSENGKYLFSNVNPGDGATRNNVAKWTVGNLAADGNGLTLVGIKDVGGRVRNMAYAKLNGRDYVFAMLEKSVTWVDMTSDTVDDWTSGTLFSLDESVANNYGSMCVSGVNGGTPTLTVATSINADNATDQLLVYTLAFAEEGGAISATQFLKLDGQSALFKRGFGDLKTTAYGNTVFVTDDNKTLYFARADGIVYKAEYDAALAEATLLPELTLDKAEYLVGETPVASIADLDASAYEVTGLSTEAAGTFTAYAEAKSDDYFGWSKATYTVKVAPAIASVTLDAATVAYGTEYAPAVTVKDADGNTVADDNYDVVYSPDYTATTSAGTEITVKVTAKGTAYSGSATAKFKVVAKEITLDVTLDVNEVNWTAEAAWPTVTVADFDADAYTVAWTVNGEEFTWPEAKPEANVEVTCTVTLDEGGNYVGSGTATFTLVAGPSVPEEQGTVEVETDEAGNTTVVVKPTEGTSEIELSGIDPEDENTKVRIPNSVEKVKGARDYQVVITYTPEGSETTYDITGAFTLSGDETEGVTYELNPDGEVEIVGETEPIPVTPTMTEATGEDAGTIADGEVATRSIPGLIYTLMRRGELGGEKTNVASEKATGTSLTLKDTTGTKPTDKAFYVIEVTKKVTE